MFEKNYTPNEGSSKAGKGYIIQDAFIKTQELPPCLLVYYN